LHTLNNDWEEIFKIAKELLFDSVGKLSKDVEEMRDKIIGSIGIVKHRDCSKADCINVRGNNAWCVFDNTSEQIKDLDFFLFFLDKFVIESVKTLEDFLFEIWHNF